MRPAVRSVVFLVCLIAFPAGARAELTPWDQAKVTELAKQLETTTAALSDAFRQQPPPTLGSSQRKAFFQLQQQVRHLRREARTMSRALQRGADFDETQPSFESLMVTVRRATDTARRTFPTSDIQTRADATRDVLNQLAPYYDPDFVPLQPPTRR
jgi:hypothetical protein